MNQGLRRCYANTFEAKLFRTRLFKTLLFMLVLLSLLILSGCGESPDSLSEYNFKQGTNELEVSLRQNAPPERIYQSTDFLMLVELENKAAYNVEDISVNIAGINSRYFYLHQTSAQVQNNYGGDDQRAGQNYLAGRSLVNPEGDKVILEFAGSAGKLLAGSEQKDVPYEIRTSYKSKVEFSDTVCINLNLYEIYDAGCKVEGHKSYSGQGAPLAVVALEEIMHPGSSTEVEYRLQLMNRGRGKVGTIKLEESFLGKKGQEILRCEFRETDGDLTMIKLDSNKQQAELVCTSGILKTRSSYQTTLVLNFSYDYELNQQKRFILAK